MIEHILVAVGDEDMDVDAIAEHVAEIASGVGAEVTLFRAFSERELSAWLDEMGYDTVQPEAMAQRHNVVNAFADVLRDANVKLTVAAEVGPASESVVEYVRSHDVDHVFLGGRRRSPTGKALLGSVSQHILLELDVPCTVMFNG